jgi:prepilin-type N-terminal cleavage/methylation domain-containing protein
MQLGKMVQNSQKGFTLIEVLIALAIFTIVMIAMVSFIPNTMNLTNNNQLKYEAVNKIMDLELDLLEKRIITQHVEGWKWTKEEDPFVFSISYVRTEGLYHVYEIRVRWETLWKSTQEVKSQTILKN